MEDIRETVRQWAATTPEVLRVWIFGSRAKGVAQEDSDVDIAVEVEATHQPLAYPEYVPDPWATFVFNADQWREELQARIGAKVDLQHYSEITQKVVKPSVDEGGILVYQRDEST